MEATTDRYNVPLVFQIRNCQCANCQDEPRHLGSSYCKRCRDEKGTRRKAVRQ